MGSGNSSQCSLSSRRLLFDDQGLMRWEHRGAGGSRRVRERAGAVRDLASARIHVVEPEILGHAERRAS